MYRGSFRSLRHPCDRPVFGPSLWASTSVVEDGEGPAPPGEFTDDRGVGDVAGLLELHPALVQAAVAQVPAGPRCWGREVPAVTDRLARHVAVLVVPGGLDQQPTGMTVPVLVIGPSERDCPDEFSEGTRPG